MTGSACLFCRIVRREVPATVVHEDEAMLAFRDIAPKAPVHLLVIPKKHIDGLSQLDAGDGALVARLLISVPMLARQEGLVSGYRTVINSGADGGQTVFHLHLHVLGGRPMTWPPG